MKLFQKKQKDERVVAEMNRIYRIGYMILSAGMAVDIYLKVFIGLPAQLESQMTRLDMAVFLGLEFVVFMAAQILCLVLMVRKGISDDDQYAETDTFAAKHYVKVSLLVGLLTGLVAGGFSLYSLGLELWILALAVFLGTFLFCAAGIVALQYAVFHMARSRRRKKERAMEEE